MFQPNKELYEFDEFRLDVTERILSRNGKRVPVAEKTFETLCALVKRGNHLVGKDELMAEVWADAIVEENNLDKNISYLRKILGGKTGEAKFIETVRGHGYRFLPVVRRVEEESPKSQVSSHTFRVQSFESEIQNPKSKIQNSNETQRSGNVLRLAKWRHEEEEAEERRGNAEMRDMSDMSATSDRNERKTPDKHLPIGPKRSRSRTVWLGAAIVVLLIGTGISALLYSWRNPGKTVIKTIAVLPFKPLVAESRDEALEMGMADALISRLGNNREVIIRPISSVRKYDNLEQDAVQAGRALGVDSVLDGNIQRWGDKIRVNIRLVRVADETSLWTETYDEKFTDIFIVQDAISKKVAAALLLQLGGDEQKRLTKRYTENVEAYQLYLKGRFFQSKNMPQDLQKAIEYFQQAIALDPNFALAYAGLAYAYAPLSDLSSLQPRELMLKAKDAALHAKSLDDQLVEEHTALGYILFKYDYDFTGAEREFKRAVELNPNDADAHRAYGELLTYLGRFEESLAEHRRALEIDPLSLGANCEYGRSLSFARRYDEAIAQLKRTLELDNSYWLAHYNLAITYNMKGDYAESVAERVKINELFSKPQTAALMRESFATGGWQGFLRAMTSQQGSPNIPPYIVATFHVELGEKDKALAILNQMYEDRAYDLVMLKVDPRLDSLRDDPRFQDLLRRINLQP